MQRDFKRSVYLDELAAICGEISRAAGFRGVARFRRNTVCPKVLPIPPRIFFFFFYLVCIYFMCNFADPTLTVESLVGVMENVISDEERRREVWENVLKWYDCTPTSYLDEVYRKYTTDKEKTHALADIYINSRPESSWHHLAQTLYYNGQMEAVKEANSFLQKNGR